MVAVVGIVVPAGLILESEFQQLQGGLGTRLAVLVLAFSSGTPDAL